MRVWWYKHTVLLFYSFAFFALIAATLAAVFLVLTSPLAIAAKAILFPTIVGLEAVGSKALVRRKQRAGIPASYWRPRVDALAAWLAPYGGTEDAAVAQRQFNRRVVRGAVGDFHVTLWSASGVVRDYPVQLLLHGVTAIEPAPHDEAAARGVLPRLHYTLMIADTGVAIPYTVVATPRADPRSDLPPTGTPNLESESFSFNDWWEVLCLDPRTGHGVFDPATIEMLLELHAKDVRIVWEGSTVVVAREGVEFDGGELDAWMALIDRMVRNGRMIGRRG